MRNRLPLIVGSLIALLALTSFAVWAWQSLEQKVSLPPFSRDVNPTTPKAENVKDLVDQALQSYQKSLEIPAPLLEQILGSAELQKTINQVLANMLQGPEMETVISDFVKSPQVQQALLDTLKTRQGRQSLKELFKTPEMKAMIIEIVRETLENP